MDKNKLNKTIDTDVHIEQVNPKQELNDLEKTAVLEFLGNNDSGNKKEEELSKTQQLKILNAKRKKVIESFEMPKFDGKKDNVVKETDESDFSLPKKVNNLTDTIRIKLSDLRAAINEREQGLDTKKVQEEKNKKSLYDTIIIKLDDIINNRKALKSVSCKKVM